MGILSYFYSATSTQVELSNGESHLSAESTSVVVVAPSDTTEPIEPPSPSPPMAPAILSPPTAKLIGKRVSIVVPPRPAATTEASEPVARGNASVEQIPEELPANVQSKTKGRRFSFKALNFSRKEPVDHKPVLSEIHDHEKREHASQASAKRAQKVQQLSRSDRRAKKSALQVRAIIVGPTSAASPKLTSETAKPQLSKLKTQLMQPKTANQVILHLRQLPANSDSHEDQSHKGPIHAVCLEHSDEEEHNLHFSKLAATDVPRDASSQSFDFPGVVSAPIEAITSAFNEMKLVDLVNTSDFGLGQPGNGNGILAGAVPTAETVIDGIKQITPELMALGYATGKAITPDHSGMHPPTDRMSILTYWWGLELLLPPPSIAYLSKAQSVSGALMNFLSAVALVNNGVREILPFIRYIAQFVDFEFAAIKKQDRGSGVVCAATWIMPAALVPRPWDFPPALDTPLQSNEPDEAKKPADQPSVPSVITVPEQPRSLNSIIDTVANPPTA